MGSGIDDTGNGDFVVVAADVAVAVVVAAVEDGDDCGQDTRCCKSLWLEIDPWKPPHPTV